MFFFAKKIFFLSLCESIRVFLGDFFVLLYLKKSKVKLFFEFWLTPNVGLKMWHLGIMDSLFVDPFNISLGKDILLASKVGPVSGG